MVIKKIQRKKFKSWQENNSDQYLKNKIVKNWSFFYVQGIAVDRNKNDKECEKNVSKKFNLLAGVESLIE
jgi:hypothetical protein